MPASHARAAHSIDRAKHSRACGLTSQSEDVQQSLCSRVWPFRRPLVHGRIVSKTTTSRDQRACTHSPSCSELHNTHPSAVRCFCALVPKTVAPSSFPLGHCDLSIRFPPVTPQPSTPQNLSFSAHAPLSSLSLGVYFHPSAVAASIRLGTSGATVLPIRLSDLLATFLLYLVTLSPRVA